MAAVEPARQRHQDDLRLPCRRLCNHASTVVLNLHYSLHRVLQHFTAYVISRLVTDLLVKAY